LVPQVRHATVDEDTGRGLFIVRTLACTWGHEYVTPSSTTAWAVLDPHPSRSPGYGPLPPNPLEDAFEGPVDLPPIHPFCLPGLRPPPPDPLERPLERALGGPVRSKFGWNQDRARPYVPPDRADWPAFCPRPRQEHRGGSLTTDGTRAP
jgi:hypothetical protein